ncbi:unnamed protein product, partial [Didymodactylos carnosus]
MGTAFAPPYANIYVFNNEIHPLINYIKKYPSSLVRYFRFIDDVLIFIFCQSSNQVDELLTLLNNNNNLKYTFETSQTNIHFLDVNIIINHTFNRIETSLFIKSSNTFQYLEYSSSHPRHIINNIAYSLSNRIIRICSSSFNKWYEFYNLFLRLVNRGHDPPNVLSKILKCKLKNRFDLITLPRRQEKQNDNNNNFYNIIVPYHQQLPPIKQFLGEHFSTELLTNHRLIYTCSSNLSRLLTRSKYPPSFRLITPIPDPPPTTGCKKCYDPI